MWYRTQNMYIYFHLKTLLKHCMKFLFAPIVSTKLKIIVLISGKGLCSKRRTSYKLYTKRKPDKTDIFVGYISKSDFTFSMQHFCFSR